MGAFAVEGEMGILSVSLSLPSIFLQHIGRQNCCPQFTKSKSMISIKADEENILCLI